MNIRAVHTKEEIANIMEENPTYKDILFARGYLLTDDISIDIEKYPFYGKWNIARIADYRVLVHPKETFFIRKTQKRTVLLIGHAYSPFSMQCDENALLAECDGLNGDDLRKKVAEWTGVFIFIVVMDKNFEVFGDAAMMKMCHYCVDNGHIYIAYHFQMIADLKGYSMCSYAQKIRATKLYNIGMRWLPGDMTSYDKIHRLGANLMLTYDGKKTSIKRIYPLMPRREANTKEEQNVECKKIFTLLNNNIKLCLQKWPENGRTALSLTGGSDSGGEFACTKGLTNKLRIFSYVSKEQEKLDSLAAKTICDAVGVPHFEYNIPTNTAELACGEKGYRIIETVIDHNTGYVKNLAENEIRKIAYFYTCNDFDVELKADVAEIGRAFYDQKYGMKMPKQFTPLQIAILQTRFLFMPMLQRQTEQKYQTYTKSIGLDKPLFNYEHSDMVYWENRIAAATGVSVLTVAMAYLQTLPYNNRAILECMLAFPHDLRCRDIPQQLLKENYMPQMIFDQATVKNKYMAKRRIMMEKLFFRFKSIPILGWI